MALVRPRCQTLASMEGTWMFQSPYCLKKVSQSYGR